MKKYIHYGHNIFDKNKFEEIQNDNFVKPEGGLWACDINAEYSWKNWNDKEKFVDCNEDNSFVFTIKDNARTLLIENSEQLKVLPQLKSTTRFNIFLDFEKLAKDYDAIEVLAGTGKGLYMALYGWDCDSILIMNKDIIILEKEEELLKDE